MGTIPVITHRKLPIGAILKTAALVKKADGYYACLVVEDKTIPQLLSLETIKSAVGIDVGLKEFLTTSTGETVAVKQHYRQAQKHLARQQRRLARKPKGSSNQLKQQNQIAKLHQKIARQRKDFHYKTAHLLVKTYDLIAVEDLNIKGLVRTKLAKSILDVAWGAFIQILEAVAVKRGVRIVKVSPYGTSQNCSDCGTKVPKTLSIRTHECPKCGLTIDRDENAAINVLNRAIEQLKAVGLIVSACGGVDSSQPMKQ